MEKEGKPRRIGVTGGIGAGKSMVSEIFSVLHIPVYNADRRAKFLMENDPEIADEIRKKFSDESFSSGKLNREFLAANVFGHKENLLILNQIVHPRVRSDFEKWSAGQTGNRYLIKEAALLFESESYKDLDKLILVICTYETRIKRIMMRDTHRSRLEIDNIIDNQLPDDEKIKLADYIIHNDDSQPVIPQVLKIHQEILSL